MEHPVHPHERSELLTQRLAEAEEQLANEQFEKSLKILENKKTREELINKIKARGQDSKIYKLLEKIVDELGLFEKHKCVDNRIVLPFVFNYLEPKFVFQTCRTVCKRWKKI